MSGSRVAMIREALRKVFKPFVTRGICVAIEAGGATRWVRDFLWELGVREAYVVNFNRLRLIAESRKRTDKADERVARLQSIPGVGLHSATSLVSAVDDIKRFATGRHLAGYCGLAPGVRNIGDPLLLPAS